MSRITTWRSKGPRSFKYVFKPRWFYIGIASATLLIVCSPWLPFDHSTNISNHYSIAWTYVTLSVAIVSLLYPLLLNIRDSLTGRLIAAYDKSQDMDVPQKINDKYLEGAMHKVADFRYRLFDKQLPFLVAFTATTVVRVLMCLMNMGFGASDSFDNQLLEPQIYVIVYLLWMAWVAATVLTLQPFKAVEELELKIRNLPNLENMSKPFLD